MSQNETNENAARKAIWGNLGEFRRLFGKKGRILSKSDNFRNNYENSQYALQMRDRESKVRPFE